MKKILRNIEIITTIHDKLKETRLKNFTNQKNMIKRQFKKQVGRDLNLTNPIYFNDKLQWLKFNWYDEKASICADKYEVRNYVKERIGQEYLNDLLFVYDNVEEVDISKLPQKFALKVTHSSGYNIICEDKDLLNWDVEKKQVKRWLKRNYYYSNSEWVYKDIKPRIIVEKYLGSNCKEELQDYRFFCFNGKVKFITVDFSITDKSKTRRNVYDLNWKKMDVEIHYPNENSIEVKKPKQLGKMIELAERLSEGFPHVRVDFYYIDDKIIFGELTFFHQTGMAKIKPIEFEKIMGDWIDLAKVEVK